MLKQEKLVEAGTVMTRCIDSISEQLDNGLNKSSTFQMMLLFDITVELQNSKLSPIQIQIGCHYHRNANPSDKVWIVTQRYLGGMSYFEPLEGLWPCG